MTENTAANLRAAAAESFARSAESFDRCDTDGFLTQWAGDITGRLRLAQAEIVEAGGVATFPALFDLDGNLVSAKFISTRYGYSWALLESDDPRSRFVGWFNPSKAQDEARAVAANARKGFYVGTVKAPAKAEIMGSGRGLAGAASCYVGVKRIDGGFSREAEIVDNGKSED